MDHYGQMAFNNSILLESEIEDLRSQLNSIEKLAGDIYDIKKFLFEILVELRKLNER